jgi:hypothetical protein
MDMDQDVDVLGPGEVLLADENAEKLLARPASKLVPKALHEVGVSSGREVIEGLDSQHPVERPTRTNLPFSLVFHHDRLTAIQIEVYGFLKIYIQGWEARLWQTGQKFLRFPT